MSTQIVPPIKPGEYSVCRDQILVVMPRELRYMLEVRGRAINVTPTENNNALISLLDRPNAGTREIEGRLFHDIEAYALEYDA